MPVYEYRCSDCNKKFEIFSQLRANLQGVACKHCYGANVSKLVSVFARGGADDDGDFAAAESTPATGGCCGGSCGCGCGS